MTCKDPLPQTSVLLSLCAVLRYFNRDLLVALSQIDVSVVDAFLSSADVEPATQPYGMFQLCDEARAAALDQLRMAQPEAEITLHELAFNYFLQRMERARLEERLPDDEASCFYHLEALRIPLIERREWGRIRQYVRRLRAAQPQQAHHLHLLSLYEGVNAIRTQSYQAGEEILRGLIADTTAIAEIHMRALNVLAQSYWFQTQYDRALESYQQAHTLATTIENQTFQAHTLLNMSMVYHEIGYYLQGLNLSNQSLELYTKLGDIYHEAHARYEVAKNAMQLGRWQEAREQFEASGALYERLGIQAQQANLYTLQAILAHALGDVEASEAWYKHSLAIGGSKEHGDPAVMMDSWLLLGLLHQTLGRWAQSLVAYEQAERLARSLQNSHVLALAAFRRGDIYRSQGRGADASISYLQALDLIETLRGNAAIEEVKLGLLGATQQIYESTVLLLLEQRRYDEAYAVAERARAQAFLDLLAAKSPELYASFEQPVVTVREVQAHLPPDALLIEYYTTGVLPSGEHLVHRLKRENPQLFQHLVSPPRIVIFALTHDQFVVREVPLDPNILALAPNELRPAQRWLHERKLRALYDQLVAPVQDLLDRSRQIFLIPHGPLHHVPFLALRAPDGRYMLDQDGPVIALAPSATVLVRNCLARPHVGEGAVIALGYNDPQVSLQHAESEAWAVANAMGGSAWIGPAAKSEALYAAAPTLRALHIAGHAVYQPFDPLGSYVSLGSTDQLSARAIMHNLTLRPSLVSLSACTSGLTQVVPGDELLGMLRAWLYAGATTVVCALWDASDIVARLVMEHFYQALSAGRSPGVAFRDAVVTVRHLSGCALAEIFADWAHADTTLAQKPALPEIHSAQYDLYPYADPKVWASFMLIGRA